MSDDASIEIDKVLKQFHTIAVVGASPNTDRPSYIVSSYLKNHGYHVIPVTPKGGEIVGEKVYPDLTSIPDSVDVVDIFRRSEDIPPIVEEAIKIGAKVVWMQEGIVNEEAAAKAREAGLIVIMDLCIKKEIQKRNP